MCIHVQHIHVLYSIYSIHCMLITIAMVYMLMYMYMYLLLVIVKLIVLLHSINKNEPLPQK